MELCHFFDDMIKASSEQQNFTKLNKFSTLDKDVMEKVSNAVQSTLDDYSLADLVEKGK